MTEDTKRDQACQVLEQMGFEWDGIAWVPPKTEYRKIMAIMQGVGDKVSTKTALDTYQGKKL